MALSSAIDATAVARVTGIKTQFLDLRAGNILFLPQRVMLVGQGSTASQGSYPLSKFTATSAGQVGSRYGYGSPLHLAAEKLLPVNGDGLGSVPLTIYPLDDAGGAVAAAGTITPDGAQTASTTYTIVVNEKDSQSFTVANGDNVASIVAAAILAINANINMPVIASDENAGTDITLTAKWAGTSGNDLFIRIDEEGTPGNTFTIVQPAGGTTSPDVDDALNLVGPIWETMLVSCLGATDTDTLDKYSTFNEGLWQPDVHRPLIAFSGSTVADVTTATSVSSVRKSDRTNSQLVAPGSEELPFVVAARQVARIARLANNNPPHDYGGLVADTLVVGPDEVQWTYTQQDLAVKAGSSTIDSIDGQVVIADTVTFYNPDDEAVPAYRFVVDIVKIQNILFNQALIFNRQDWNGAPMIPDEDPTVNPAAKQPKMAKADIASMIDSLALNAILSDPTTAKASIRAAISSSNPKRLDLVWTGQVSGNSNIKSLDFNWGFYYGAPVVLN